jgi:hypothetical protein
MSKFCTAEDGTCGVLVAEPNETQCSKHRVKQGDTVHLYIRQRGKVARTPEEDLQIEGSVSHMDDDMIWVTLENISADGFKSSKIGVREGNDLNPILGSFPPQLFQRRTLDGKGWVLEANLSF